MTQHIIDTDELDFGAYVLIEQKRYGVANEMYQHKVIGRLKSNTYVDVPVQSPATAVIHDEVVDVVACICCGVQETNVLKYRVCDVIKIANSPQADDVRKDAERYRWLRGSFTNPNGSLRVTDNSNIPSGAKRLLDIALDEAIDKARE